nr:bromo adjacent homology (BAH) domain, zinc finger, RING/FYVE/PHD-type [Tanacetum cinerariifolium]
MDEEPPMEHLGFFTINDTEEDVIDAIEAYCKCLLPYNPDEYMLQCHACKDWYHSNCLNMTEDEAKQLDRFTCDREQCFDGKRPHNQSSASADPDMVETKRPKR